MKGWGERTKLVSLQRFTGGGQCDRRHLDLMIEKRLSRRAYKGAGLDNRES